MLPVRFRFASSFRHLVLFTLGLMLTSGCQPPASTPTADGDGKLRIAVIPKGTTHVFWKSVHFGAQQAADELGVEIQWRGPQKESDRDEQINVVQGFVNKQVDGIVLAPLDAEALVRPVQEAGRADIPVVIFDSALAAPADAFASYVATDNFRGGQLAADAMAKAMGEKGNVILLRYNKGSESTHQREEGFLDAIAKYKSITVLSSDQYAGTTTESAIDKAQQVLNRYADQVDGIFAVCEPNAEGVLRALKDRQLAGKVAFVGFDPSPSMRQALAEGEMTAIILQDPVQMGYLAVKTVVEKIRGGDVEPYIDTGVYVATPDNYQQPQISRLLDPEKA